MKQFLRYQISGTVFMLWFVIFFYGGEADTLKCLLIRINESLKDFNVIFGLAVALPVGVIIHQFSVIIKNCLLGRVMNEFSDFPKIENIINIHNKRIKVDYILERISNLNSFYYVRFDNGVLSPLLAWVMVSWFMDININSMWLFSALLIGIITVAYIPRIWCELKFYKNILKKPNQSSTKK